MRPQAVVCGSATGPVVCSMVHGSPRKQALAGLGVTCRVAPTDALPVRSRYTGGHHHEADTSDRCGRWIVLRRRLLHEYRAPLEVSDELAAHLTPAQHDHINFYGTYSFDIDAELRRGGRRPLRIPA